MSAYPLVFTALVLAVSTSLVACDTLGDGGGGHRLDGRGESPGFRVATDGATAVLGAGDGPAAIHERSADGWARTADPLPDGVRDRDNYGWSVAVDGDVAVVGAYTTGQTFGNEPGGETPGSGVAYVYRREGGRWAPDGRLELDRSRLFGAEVAVDGGDILVMTGASEDGDAPFDLVVFRKEGDAWLLAQTLSGAVVGSRGFRGGLAARNGLAAVGVRGSAGEAVAVLRRAGGTWTLEAVVPAPSYNDVTSTSSDGGVRFGSAVATDGVRVAVGAPSADVGGVSSAGLAFVLDGGPGGWAVTARLDNPEPSARDFFAESVGVDGSLVVVGSEAEQAGDRDDRRGVAFTFAESGVTWALSDRLSEPGAFSFGFRLALARGTLVVGSPYGADGNGGGSAYAYRRVGSGWAPDDG